MTLKEIARKVAERRGYTIKESEEMIKALLIEIDAGLTNGEEIMFQNFFSLKKVATKARIGRNPKTGEAIPIPEGTKIKFKASERLGK